MRNSVPFRREQPTRHVQSMIVCNLKIELTTRRKKDAVSERMPDDLASLAWTQTVVKVSEANHKISYHDTTADAKNK